VSAASETDEKRSEPGSRWPLLIAVTFASLVAAALIAIGVWHGLESGLRLEFGKAGLNLIVLAILGAGVTAAVQHRAGQREARWRVEAEGREERRGLRAEQREERRGLAAEKREERRGVEAEEREERRRREAEQREQERRALAETQEARRQDSDYALDVLRDIIANYNRLKAARRAMRAVGLHDPGPARISSTQATEFERQMGVVAEVQLAFEAVARELDTRLDKDAINDGDDGAKRREPAPEVYQIAIEQLADYVEAIVREWERHGREVAAGDAPDAVASRDRLQAFLRSSRTDPNKEFRTSAAEPLRTLQLFFRQRLLVPLLRKEPTSPSATGLGSPGGHAVDRNP
jgi:beta-phosphoglucomutase-like phosphatase (HAD superfamily)